MANPRISGAAKAVTIGQVVLNGVMLALQVAGLFTKGQVPKHE